MGGEGGGLFCVAGVQKAVLALGGALCFLVSLLLGLQACTQPGTRYAPVVAGYLHSCTAVQVTWHVLCTVQHLAEPDPLPPLLLLPFPYTPFHHPAVYGEIEFECGHWGVFENAIDMAHIHYLHADSFGNR